MRITESCAACLYDKQKHLSSDEQYLSEIRRIIDNRGEDDTSPYLVYLFRKAYEKHFGQRSSYREIKKKYNDLVLSMEDSVRKRIEESEDPLAKAFVYARIGNYIDFGAMNHVDEKTFLSLFDGAELGKEDAAVMESFQNQCRKAQHFLLITDNCGEIVLDKLAVKLVKERYPHLAVTGVVRGFPVVNDATMEDARMTGLDQVIPVMGNGDRVAGTNLEDVDPRVRRMILDADLILAKGQGNFETLHGCGLNIYYLFLCKCDWFMRQFQARRYQGVFVNERRIWKG